jgi:hypothetical protein
MFEKYGVFDQAMAIQRALWYQARNKAYGLVPRTKEGELLIEILDAGCNRTK